VAVAIRRPADDSRVWKPNRAVLGHLAPARRIRRDLHSQSHRKRHSGRIQSDPRGGHVTAPVVKVVIVIAEALNVGVELVDSGKRAGFSRMNGVSGTAAGDFALTVANNDDGGIAGFVDVDLVVAGRRMEKARFGVSISKVSSFSRRRTRTFRVPSVDADLRHAVVQIQERKTGVAGKTDCRGADVQLGERTVVSPKLVTLCNRTVDDRGNPSSVPAGLNETVPPRVAETRYAAGGSSSSWACGALRRKREPLPARR